MKPTEVVAVAFYVAIASFALYYGSKVVMHEPRVMCGVAEISPDIDAKQKEQCRQIRGHKL